MSTTRSSTKKMLREHENRVRAHAERGVKRSSRSPIDESPAPVKQAEAAPQEQADRFEPVSAQPEQRTEGTVVAWREDRCFGFIGFRTSSGYETIFFHKSGILPIEGVVYEPRVGCDVSFVFGFDRGRCLAIEVAIHSWPEVTAEEYFMKAPDLPLEAPATQPACLSPENRNKSLRELIAS